MSDGTRVGTPLTLTRSPALDAAARAGWDAWLQAARGAGAGAVAGWMAQRAGDPELRREVLPLVRGAIEAEDAEERVEALLGLAELAGEVDDLLADTLWEGALAAGREAEDPDLMFEATGRLATIAEAHADPLAAAEYYLDFLNWRRGAGRASDPEAVETAFDEVVRLATLDGAQKEAAVLAYRQARYTRLLEEEDDRAFAGDWEADPAPYAGWG